MTALVARAMTQIIRFGIYLLLTGNLISCTMELKENAYKSVTGGLVSLKAINKALNVPGN